MLMHLKLESRRRFDLLASRSRRRPDDRKEMSVKLAKRFAEYAVAFQETFADDDWSRPETYFTEDAIYAVTGGPPFGGRWEGREQLLQQLCQSVNEVDRTFDKRCLELLGTPTIGEDSVKVRWRVTYTKAGDPDVVAEGTERATFEGDRIRLLEDEIEDNVDE